MKQIQFIDPVGRRIAKAVDAWAITPKYRRIVLGGDDLATGFPYVHFAPSDHVKLFFPHPTTSELVVPHIAAKGWRYDEGAGEPTFRDYTVRAWDPEKHELTIDFVVHEHGVAGIWARDAQPGWQIGVLGPRGNILFPAGCDRYVAFGDETALPAIARLIEEAPTTARADAIIEVADAAEHQQFAEREGLTITWIDRDTAAVAEGHGSALETAARQLPLDAGENVFVFAAGEANALKPIRRWLRREIGLPKERVEVDGYWKTGVENLDHHSNEIDDD